MTYLEDLLGNDDAEKLTELTLVIAALLCKPFLTEEAEPDLYRLARLQEHDLRQWFQATLGWRLKISAFGRCVRLFKRRDRPQPTEHQSPASTAESRPYWS